VGFGWKGRGKQGSPIQDGVNIKQSGSDKRVGGSAQSQRKGGSNEESVPQEKNSKRKGMVKMFVEGKMKYREKISSRAKKGFWKNWVI